MCKKRRENKKINIKKNSNNEKILRKMLLMSFISILILISTFNVKAANQESLNTLDVEEYLANTTKIEDENIEDEEVNVEKIQKEVIETSANVEEFKLDSRIALIYDRLSGRIIYEKNGNKQTPMASTTKIMTAIVVLENANLKETVTIDAKAAGVGGSRLGLKKNDKITVNDLLYGLMLRSRK